ncbi:hypothetical protein [Streptomyces violaceusniger]|nr:hypothetical protein [Streptomyces violaceusniger]
MDRAGHREVIGAGYGGTADVVAYAEHTGLPTRVVWPQGATRD